MYFCTHMQVSIVQEVNMNVYQRFFLKNILVEDTTFGVQQCERS